MRKICEICLIIAIIALSTVSYADDTEYDRLVDIPVPDNSTGYADSTITEKMQEIEKYEQEEENKENEQNEQKEEKELEERKQNMKNCYKIIIPIIALAIVVIAVNMALRKEEKNNAQEQTNSLTEQNNTNKEVEEVEEEDSIKNVDTKEVEEIKENINSTADTDIYYVEQESDGRKILQIKPKIQFEVDLAGILKNSKPEENELEELLKNQPKKTGLWVSKQSRDSFLQLLKKNDIDEFTIKEDGYLEISKDAKNENAKKIADIVKSNKLYIINMTGMAFQRDYISGEIQEYPFEEMDPDQVLEIYEDGNKVIFEITSNKNRKISESEILEEIIANYNY